MTPRRLTRDALIFAAFAALTVLMTWPWVLQVRDAAPDAGDPYLVSWILWWDYHAAFHDPLNLFHANILYPSRYALAFSEHCFGIALPFFPLFALGVPPLTVHGVATLVGIAFCGFGAFRLTRTLTGDSRAAWIAGIAFAFIPFRFHHLAHLPYLFAGWIPILVEALVLFVRQRTPRRAAWLGAAFLFNALTSIHWFVLTLVPLAVIGAVLALRENAASDGALYRRGATALGAASLVLLPFLLPYRAASRLYGLSRPEAETLFYSARWSSWLTSDPRNKLWAGFGVSQDEQCLFPGLLPILLALAGYLLVARHEPRPGDVAPPAPAWRPWALRVLDGLAVVAASVGFLASGAQPFRLVVGGSEVLRSSNASRALFVLSILLLVRWSLAYPRAFLWAREANLLASLRASRQPDVLWVGGLLLVVGFVGSFGLNLPFHRALFELFELFRSIRAPARSAMVADLGLAILAGAGAARLSRRGSLGAWLCAAALLFELRVAPLELIRGPADPDALSLALRRTPMQGGLVDLPSAKSIGSYASILRAADHGKPLINAMSGFAPPHVEKLDELLSKEPIPDEVMSHLESIPTSYLVVRESLLDRTSRSRLHDFLSRGLTSRRLAFVGRFDGALGNDLYVVTRTEPGAEASSPRWASTPPWASASLTSGRRDDGLTGSVDLPADGGVVTGDLVIVGWARIPGENLDVQVLIDGDRRVPDHARRYPRPDVGQAVPAISSDDETGYEARFRFRPGLDTEGPHDIEVVFRSNDGRFRVYPRVEFTWKR